MDRTPINSTRIVSAGYDAETATLEVEFHRPVGALYSYSEVPPDVFDGLIESSSAGAYFDQAIKGVFAYRRIS